jgi:hypothetical protein
VRFKFDFPAGDLKRALKESRDDLAVKLTGATRRATARLVGDLRQQVRAAGLGMGLEKAWRAEDFPRGGKTSLHPAGMVWSKATALHDVYDHGATITAHGGRWLAIPTPFAIARGWGSGPRSRKGGTVPAGRLRSYAQTKAAAAALGGLRFVKVGPGRAVLVYDPPEGATPTRGRVRRGFRPKQDRGAVVFILVRQVRVKPTLDFAGAAKRAGVAFGGLLRAAVSTRSN